MAGAAQSNAAAVTAIANRRWTQCHHPGSRAPSPPQHQPPRREPVRPPGDDAAIKRTGFDG